MIKQYQKTINKIDDYLEYRYKSHSPDKIKETIMGYIDELTTSLPKTRFPSRYDIQQELFNTSSNEEVIDETLRIVKIKLNL